ncbi:hypothetical protein MMUC44124_25820 [Mycolicibacterium mucogenicum DSM 44124]|nr:hypothetical protein MMUC44124_25820 [Mycolicibacterium mucogenicum DSM 44124]
MVEIVAALAKNINEDVRNRWVIGQRWRYHPNLHIDAIAFECGSVRMKVRIRPPTTFPQSAED